MSTPPSLILLKNTGIVAMCTITMDVLLESDFNIGIQKVM